MSIINNVLKDLERRSSQFTPIDIASVENLVVQKPKKAFPYATALLMILVLASLAIGLYLSQQVSVKAENQIELAPVTPDPIMQPVPLPDESVLPVNQIVDLQIRESVDDMTLKFSLRGKVVSYLKERTKNSFIYHLKNIESEIVAPNISHNRWIEEFSLTGIDEGMDISFRTATGVLVETRQHLEDGKQIWSIKLKKIISPVHLTTQIKLPVKKSTKIPKAENKVIDVVTIKPVPKVEATLEAPSEAKVVKLDIRSSQVKLSSREQLQKARVSIQNRRWNESEKLLRALIDGPEDMAARTLLLSIYQSRQQTGSFSVLVRESIQLYPQQALFITEYARSLFQLKAYTEVIDLLSVQQDANPPQMALLAASHQRLDQHLQAIDYYQQSLNQDSRQVKSWIGLGISQEQSAQFEAALRSYTTAVRLGSLNKGLKAFVDKRINQLAQVAN